MLTIYKGLVLPCMEYASHLWGSSTHTVLLDRVESKAFRHIGCPSFISYLLLVKFRRTVACLSVFYRYLHAHCSSELADFMLPSLPAASPNSAFLFCSPLFCPNPLCKSRPVPLFFHLFHWSALEPLSCVCISSFL